jgi:hypothetical protein
VESFPKLGHPDEHTTWYGGLLTPVAFAFGRFCEKSRVESLSLKFFPWFEVPQFNQKQLLPATFDVHFDPARDHNTLVIEIGERPQVGENLSPVHPSAALAAVEILIRDLDEPQRCVTLERELLSQTDFLLVERDFRNASLWESVGADPPSSTNQQSPTSSQPIAWYDETKNVEWLNLHNQLKSLSCETWREAFGKLRSLYACIYQYQQTSTFVNSYAPNWERLALAVRLLMAGCKVTDETNPNQLHSLPKLSTNWNSLLDLIREVESIDGEDLEEKELDEWLIKLKLVSILRHRLEIGQEIFGSEDDVLVVKSSDIDQETDVLPLQTLFNEALGKVNIIDKEFSGKVSGLVYSPLETVNAPWWNFNWLKPTNTADGFKVLDDDANVQACVPHLTGLAVLIRKLKSHLQRQRGWRLVKRPHNTVQTVINSSGMRVAVSTPASQLLPERLADSTNGSTQANFNAIPPIFLANILERLGFAVDLAAYDSLGQQIPGVELHHEIASYVHKDPESRLFVHVVWLPVENRGDVDISLSMSSYGQDCQPQPQSYGFLKLAVLSSVLGTHPSGEYLPSALEEVVKNRMVDLKTSGSQPNLTEVIRDQINKWSSHPARLVTIPVRPRGQRVQTLCLHAGVARCYWIEVDLKRHRYAISVKGISRYAPLERWLNLNPNASGEPASQDQRSHDQEVEIVTQRHLVPTDEQLSAPTVYPRSDPHRVIFSYSLPAEGQRSLLNHLSAIRTGWHGVETQWLWRNPWLNQTPDSFKSFNEYCDYIHNATGLDDLEYQSPPEPSPPNGQEPLAIISNQESLFRGERFMIAHYLPYCLEYDLRTRTVYEGLCGEWSSPRSAWIRRLPVIPLKSQDAVRIGSDQTIFKLICPSDLMTANEIEVLERFKAECSQEESSLWIGDIPDPEMVYRLYLKQPQPDGKTLYRLLDTVAVPFAQGLPPSTQGNLDSRFTSASEYKYTLYRSPIPVARYYLGINLNDLFGDVEPPPAATSNPLPIIVQSQYKGVSSKLGSS